MPKKNSTNNKTKVKKDSEWWSLPDLDKAVKDAEALTDPEKKAKILSAALKRSKKRKDERSLVAEYEVKVIKAACKLPVKYALTVIKEFLPVNAKGARLAIKVEMGLIGDKALEIVIRQLLHTIPMYITPAWDDNGEYTDQTYAKIAAELVTIALSKASPEALKKNLSALEKIAASPSKYVRLALAKELKRFGKQGTKILESWLSNKNDNVRFTAEKAISGNKTPKKAKSINKSYAIDQYAKKAASNSVNLLPKLKKKVKGTVNKLVFFVYENSFRITSLVLETDDEEFPIPVKNPQTNIPGDVELTPDYDHLLHAFFKANEINIDDPSCPSWGRDDALLPLLFYRELLLEMHEALLPEVKKEFLVSKKLEIIIGSHDDFYDYSSIKSIEKKIKRELNFFSDKNILKSFLTLCFKDKKRQDYIFKLWR